ncbi:MULTISPECIES: aspartate carbamoyltransferase catalytic subunit [Prochlorococcus]|uniref:Aspartate carbamoyltransferase catalytic subunit n=1 Tax=Prochlorococcus marinus (strain SARG / CCMP1375 / SS120) TaxID=167539 RepID=PYRB_PROMA|nr:MULTISPECIES: aspartate carbamoyltransferase catalytic subunit [Prochlorococcus]Q7VDV6.1 RecName: Full=Aspartate carbamoyltransferase catalytic subunit; AltName: Full=Aspartate transcarbamylase; Short=ATCase [Prochlorococcus marinus subsp. marinus str. CCMP1375]AAP99308.1 Aspartate carbamoyltransferase [Prochlorococcus marinus subsp. marinus str. CCMP1375]KGG11420.1 Aspartate carbamoyltransferase [Prochlorococcus marinus str. LG]KGG18624.1 Aspartate carbamoyltransferase [Prochlorococcus mari
MSNWSHKHILDLSSFSIEDYQTVVELANRFKTIPRSGSRKLPALQGRLIATLFFEPSTRTRSSFELAAKRLSADVQSFAPSNSSLIKGETPLDTVMTYVAMGAHVLVVRHGGTGVPEQLAKSLDQKKKNVSILNGGDGLHSHPSQGLLDLFTLTQFFNKESPSPRNIAGKRIAIVGDILHSRVARSNLWSLTACGANVVLCGPPSLLPDDFAKFVEAPPSGQKKDPIKNRGKVTISRCLKEALTDTDAVITLRLQKERMSENLLSNLDKYHNEYGITHESLKWCGKHVPVLHPGPVNRGIEMSSELLEDNSISLIENQVSNGIPIRMALLYLLSADKN